MTAGWTAHLLECRGDLQRLQLRWDGPCNRAVQAADITALAAEVAVDAVSQSPAFEMVMRARQDFLASTSFWEEERRKEELAESGEEPVEGPTEVGSPEWRRLKALRDGRDEQLVRSTAAKKELLDALTDAIERK